MVDHAANRNSKATSTVASPPVRSKPAVPSKPGRWFKRLLIVAVLCALAIWFAPTIIASTRLRNSLTKVLLPKFPGTIELGETSLGWFSPIEVKNLRVDDDEGKPVLEIAKFRSTAPLLSLMLQSSDLGTFKITEPVLRGTLTNHDSNLERLLAKLVDDKSRPRKPTPRLTFEVDNGRVELDHSPSMSHSSVEGISLRGRTGPAGLEELNLAVGAVPQSGESDARTDWIAVRFWSPGAENTLTGASDNVSPAPAEQNSQLSTRKRSEVRAAGWKLDRLKPAFARIIPGSDLQGELTVKTTMTFQPAKPGLEWDWDGEGSLAGLKFSASESPLRDKLQLDRINISGRAVATHGRLALQDIKMTSDVGEVSATGDFSLDPDSKQSPGQLLQTFLADENYHLQGHVDLKKLAAIAPQTLHIRDGIEITAGDIQAEVVGTNVQGQRRWSGTTKVVELIASNRGQQVTWAHPIAVHMNSHRDRDSLVIDLLECQSDFLQIQGKGTLEDAKFTAKGDLSKLAQNLGQFVDLGLEQLTGQLNGQGEIQRTDAEHVSLNARILLDDFACGVHHESAWREKHLELSIVSTAQVDDRPSLIRIDSGEAHLRSGNDVFDVHLDQPVDFKVSPPTYLVQARMNGELRSWQNRLRPFVAMGEWQLNGKFDFASRLSADANQVTIAEFKSNLKGLTAEAPGWKIKDEEITIETSGKWDKVARTLTSPRSVLNGKSVAAQLTEFDCSMGPVGITKLTGSATYRTELVQLSSWRNLAIPNPTNYLVGTLTGSARLTQQDQFLTADLESRVEKFIVLGLETGPNGQLQWAPVWKEPLLTFTGKGRFNPAGDMLTLETSEFSMDGFSAEAKGILSECSTKQRLDLSGQLNYDWDQLIKRLGPQQGPEILLTGKDQRSFSLKGSLASLGGPPVTLAATDNAPAPQNVTDLSGSAGLGWATANLYGIIIGPGDIAVQIDQGICRFKPIDLAVNDGRMHASPVVYFDRNPFVFVLPEEKLIDRVGLSRELCASWMKYVAPMLADAAQVEGRVSLDMKQAAIPVGSLATGTGLGVLTVHGAQARPGVLAQQVLLSINQLRSVISRQQMPNPVLDQVWVEMPEQQVPIKLEQGRMWHEGMTFLVANMTVKTSGSVGLDNSLDLVAQIPLKDEWFGNQRGIAALKGKAIQIPITGTVTRPHIDPKVFGQLARELGGSMLDDLLQDKVGGGLGTIINNGIDDLIRRKKQ